MVAPSDTGLGQGERALTEDFSCNGSRREKARPATVPWAAPGRHWVLGSELARRALPCYLLAQVLAEVAVRTEQACAADPHYLQRRLTEQNATAVLLHKAGDSIGALAAYALLFRRQRAHNLAHAELHVCYTCAAGPC